MIEVSLSGQNKPDCPRKPDTLAVFSFVDVFISLKGHSIKKQRTQENNENRRLGFIKSLQFVKLHTPPSVGLTDAQANPSLRLAHMKIL